MKECVLGGSLPDIGYHGTENKNNKRNKNGKTRPSSGILSMFFLSLENFAIPELWDLFHLCNYRYLA